jgi:hypothetical protein
MEEQKQMSQDYLSLVERVLSGEYRREREEESRRMRKIREEAEYHLAEAQRLLDSQRR